MLFFPKLFLFLGSLSVVRREEEKATIDKEISESQDKTRKRYGNWLGSILRQAEKAINDGKPQYFANNYPEAYRVPKLKSFRNARKFLLSSPNGFRLTEAALDFIPEDKKVPEGFGFDIWIKTSPDLKPYSKTHLRTQKVRKDLRRVLNDIQGSFWTEETLGDYIETENKQLDGIQFYLELFNLSMSTASLGTSAWSLLSSPQGEPENQSPQQDNSTTLSLYDFKPSPFDGKSCLLCLSPPLRKF